MNFRNVQIRFNTTFLIQLFKIRECGGGVMYSDLGWEIEALSSNYSQASYIYLRANNFARSKN